jgi:hypothetical protein
MHFSIAERLCLDQVFIKSMAKMRKVEAPEHAMPISIVALGLMEIVKGILVFGNRLLFCIPYLLTKMKDPFMEIVRFRIFGKEVSPKSSFNKSSDRSPFR